jgi:hypothetical protein
MDSAPNEQLTRFGVEPESADDLADQAAKAGQILGIHGVSVTGRATSAPGARAQRADVEKFFRVHDTPSRRDKLHRTVELPKPVTAEVADQFNQLFGRG